NSGSRDSGIERESFVHPLTPFVSELHSKLTDPQKRALRVTWKRLSEAPKTSGRGTIQIMERILDKLIDAEPSVPSLFYKSAFLSCIEDRRCTRTQSNERRWATTIATLRDHAHILVRFVDTIIQLMFDGTTANVDMPDPETIGIIHNRLYPLGFNRKVFNMLGECFAEVFFMQECVRAYPHAASAWSLLCVSFTDRMYAACKPTSSTASSIVASASHHKFDFPPVCPARRSTSRPLELPTTLRIHKPARPSSCHPSPSDGPSPSYTGSDPTTPYRPSFLPLGLRRPESRGTTPVTPNGKCPYEKNGITRMPRSPTRAFGPKKKPQHPTGKNLLRSKSEVASKIIMRTTAAAKNKIKKRRNPRKSTQYISLNTRRDREDQVRPSVPPTPASPLLSPSSAHPPFSSIRQTQSPISGVKFTFTQTISIQADPVDTTLAVPAEPVRDPTPTHP
ncbi:hypothetical protein PFISCL1PPCAC_3593, partial [Pristionchus fissidentatus]